jgi:hypothetical protein
MNFDVRFEALIANMKFDGRYRTFIELDRLAGEFPTALWRGPDGSSRRVTVWCSNDYLGMGQHPDVLLAMQRTNDRSGAVVPRVRAGTASGISTTTRFGGILLGFVALSTILAIVVRFALTRDICTSFASHCAAAAEFAGLVAAGDVPKAAALISPVDRTIAIEIAHRGYAAVFSAALLAAAMVAGLSAMVVAFLMWPARGRSSEIAFAAERGGVR